MNTRIKELAEQARIKDHWCMDERRYLTNYLDEQKFAELIVKKFDDILLLQQLDSIGNRDKKSNELVEKIRLNTKTYFGVNE
jgi:hypothetical protein